MKSLFVLLTAFILTGCSMEWAPPPQGYHSYKTYNKRIDIERVKKDMTECGFPDVNNVNPYFVHNHDGYVASNLCMEHKGYKDSSLPRGVCYRYSDSSPCQARQSNNPK